MQRYEIPIYQVCDSVRYHAIAEHFLKNYQLLTINYQLRSRFPEVIDNSLHLFGRERLASLLMTQLCLSDTRRTNQMTHLPAHFVIFVVGIHEFYVCEMSC